MCSFFAALQRAKIHGAGWSDPFRWLESSMSHQTLHVEKEEIPTPDEAENKLVNYFREHPEMLENSHTQLLLLRLRNSNKTC